ncbi:MAG: hypothetical protein ACREXX_02775 [Gammaproteobacteria bacterium]
MYEMLGLASLTHEQKDELILTLRLAPLQAWVLEREARTTASEMGPSAFSAPAAATIGSRQSDAKEISDDGSPYRGESPRANLGAARRLIERCGYWRRKEKLEDAEDAAKDW